MLGEIVATSRQITDRFFGILPILPAPISDSPVAINIQACWFILGRKKKKKKKIASPNENTGNW